MDDNRTIPTGTVFTQETNTQQQKQTRKESTHIDNPDPTQAQKPLPDDLFHIIDIN